MTSIESKEAKGGGSRWWSLVRRDKRKRADLGILIFSVVMTLAAFVFNMGWIRFIFLFTAMPLILMGLYVCVGCVVYWEKWRSRLFYAASLFHPLSYILLYDSSDSGPSYIFFGQVPIDSSGEDLANLLVVFAMLSFAISFLVLFMVIVQMWLSRKKAPSEKG